MVLIILKSVIYVCRYYFLPLRQEPMLLLDMEGQTRILSISVPQKLMCSRRLRCMARLTISSLVYFFSSSNDIAIIEPLNGHNSSFLVIPFVYIFETSFPNHVLADEVVRCSLNLLELELPLVSNTYILLVEGDIIICTYYSHNFYLLCPSLH